MKMKKYNSRRIVLTCWKSYLLKIHNKDLEWKTRIKWRGIHGLVESTGRLLEIRSIVHHLYPFWKAKMTLHTFVHRLLRKMYTHWLNMMKVTQEITSQMTESFKGFSIIWIPNKIKAKLKISRPQGSKLKKNNNLNKKTQCSHQLERWLTF